MKTNFISVIATVLAMAAATAAYGVDYYVDANNGNDESFVIESIL
jgi:hypothetical protein